MSDERHSTNKLITATLAALMLGGASGTGLTGIITPRDTASIEAAIIKAVSPLVERVTKTEGAVERNSEVLDRASPALYDAIGKVGKLEGRMDALERRVDKLEK